MVPSSHHDYKNENGNEELTQVSLLLKLLSFHLMYPPKSEGLDPEYGIFFFFFFEKIEIKNNVLVDRYQGETPNLQEVIKQIVSLVMEFLLQKVS